MSAPRVKNKVSSSPEGLFRRIQVITRGCSSWMVGITSDPLQEARRYGRLAPDHYERLVLLWQTHERARLSELEVCLDLPWDPQRSSARAQDHPPWFFYVVGG